MNDFMKERILRRLEPLSDERLYQVLDYIEFLESKYAQHEAATPNVFQRFSWNRNTRSTKPPRRMCSSVLRRASKTRCARDGSRPRRSRRRWG